MRRGAVARESRNERESSSEREIDKRGRDEQQRRESEHQRERERAAMQIYSERERELDERGRNFAGPRLGLPWMKGGNEKGEMGKRMAQQNFNCISHFLFRPHEPLAHSS